MAFALNIGKCTLLGNYRENNEDSIEVKQFPELTVCIVADGMGGQAYGEVASRRAIEIIPRELRKHLHSMATPDMTKDAIRRCILLANEEIMQMGALDKDMKNMGTTIVMAVWRRSGEMYIAGVGDSRAYIARSRAIKQLTVDHSLAQALVEAGTISPAEAKEHRYRNVLWKFLGSRELTTGRETDVIEVRMQPGDKFLLCSDGLTGVVTDEKLLNHMQANPDVQICADSLGQLALDSNSRDNVSAIVIEAVEAT